MDPEWLKAEFAKRAPWIFQFRIGEADYGGHVSAIGDVRIDEFHAFAPEAETILELGALEGAHTFMLAQHPRVKRVMALEGRAANIRKAEFLQELFGATNVEFAQANLETDPLACRQIRRRLLLGPALSPAGAVEADRASAVDRAEVVPLDDVFRGSHR